MGKKKKKKVFWRNGSTGDDSDGSCMQTDLLIADEPTSGLDVTIQIQVLDLIGVTQETGAALLMITHDINIIKGMCDRIVVMYSGTVMEIGTLKKLWKSLQILTQLHF